MGGKKVLLACFSMAFAAALLPTTKASAKLTLDSVDYDKSTITITSDSKDSILYFSDKKMKKWDTALSSFNTDSATNVTKCVMDMSWVTVTKDYEITLKGDQSNKESDILHVTIPKQVKNFKAKYDKKTGNVLFTNDGTRIVQYRKKNTSLWNDVEKDPEAFKSTLQRLRDNGSSLYFRLKAENGSNGLVGQRYSKEVVCSIAKKSNAPKIKVNSDATISVESGLQVRRLCMEQGKNDVKYISGFDRIDSVSESEVDSESWYTYKASRDVPISEMANDIAPNQEADGVSSNEVYLQFRKSGTSSAQMSRITTAKIPKQETAPDEGDVRIEYTSSTTFKVTFAKATTKNQYEYCFVEDTDVKKTKSGKIDLSDPFSDPSSIVWKKSSSSVSAEIKKADAPENSWLFFRKKMVGALGDDDFRLPSAIAVFNQKIVYPSNIAGTITLSENKPFELIDGECTSDNSKGHITFSSTVSYGAIVSEIRFSTSENPTSAEEATAATATFTSSKQKDGDNYIVTTKITSLTLSTEVAKNLENGTGLSSDGKLELYGYVVFGTRGSEPVYITSNKTSGLRIHVSPKSKIVIPDGTDPKNKIKVTHLLGITSGGAIEKYKDFRFKVNYGTKNVKVSGIKLGNYSLTEKSNSGSKGHYSVSNSAEGTGIVTVDLQSLEEDPKLAAYYGTTQILTVELSNGTGDKANTERLKDVTITLKEPVSLDGVYAWAFTRSSLPDTEQTVTITDKDGNVTEKTIIGANSYHIGYSKASISADDGISVSVQSVTPIRAELKGVNILAKNTDDNKLEFYNTELKRVSSCTNEPVKLVFSVSLSDGSSYLYTINRGCTFTIL